MLSNICNIAKVALYVVSGEEVGSNHLNHDVKSQSQHLSTSWKSLECRASFVCKEKNLVFTLLSLFSLFFSMLYDPVRTCQRNLPIGHEGLVNLLSIKVDFKV